MVHTNKGRMANLKDTKLIYDGKLYQHIKNNGYFIVQHKATGKVNRTKVRQKNHVEFIEPFLLDGIIAFREVRRENNIGQAINGKGTVVKPERQNQVTAKVKRSMVHNSDGNLIRNGG